LNIKVVGQRSKSHGLLCVLCAGGRDIIVQY